LGDVSPSCAQPVIEALDAALATSDVGARDSALAALQTCEGLPTGWVLALRAEFAPAECADAIVAPWFEGRAVTRTSKPLRLDIEHALVGMAIAARLRRVELTPPRPPAALDKQAFLDFFEQRLKPWVVDRAKLIHSLSLTGSRLQGFGRGIAAVEAAVADLRFVEMARSIELPSEMHQHADVKSAYYAALDEALEPRKARGRDAALAGLDEFAKLGVLESDRVRRARQVLSRSYAGHRIDALDGLLLPALPPPPEQTPEQRLAARLPTFFVADALPALDPSDPTILRALLVRGLDAELRHKLDAGALTLESAELYARFYVYSGQRYFRSGDFARAAQLASLAPTGGRQPSVAARLIRALAGALASGPKDAREMIVGGPLLPLGVGNVEQLDQLSAEPDDLGGMSAYDAAYVLALLPPLKEPKRFWKGIGDRFELAAKKLTDVRHRDLATEAARSARQTAAAVAD
jgi:hypothetical protein